MRRLLTLGVLALAFAAPAAALADAFTAAADGTIVLKNADGRVYVKGNGVFIGHIQHVVKMTVNDPLPFDGDGPPIVTNWDEKTELGTRTTYTGDDLRFKLLGGRYTIQIKGTGISLSGVGSGVVYLDGDGTKSHPADGLYSLDGSPFRTLPNVWTGPVPFGL